MLAGNFVAAKFITRLSLPFIALLPLQAWAGCKDDLADIDQRIAAAAVSDQDRMVMQQMRAMAGQMCDAGQEMLAQQYLAALKQQLPNDADIATEQKASADSKAMITNEYLAGTWCPMVEQEQVQITFRPDGSYVVCFHDSMQGRFGHCPESRQTTQEWLAEFDRARNVTQNSMELGSDNKMSGGYTTYKRGECSKYGI